MNKKLSDLELIYVLKYGYLYKKSKKIIWFFWKGFFVNKGLFMNEVECLVLFEKYKLLFNLLLKYFFVFERMYCFDCVLWIIVVWMMCYMFCVFIWMLGLIFLCELNEKVVVN